jgi:hypothetical protein
MKRLSYLMAMLVFLAYACSRDDSLNSDQSLNNAGLKSAGIVIKVLPNGTDDTQAISDAFAQAKAAGPGSVVQLAEGTFHIGFIEVNEFDGTLSGSGKGSTIITNLPGLTPDAVIALNKVPALITFIGGDVSVSDLSVNLSEGLNWLGTKEMNMLLFSDYSTDFTPAIKRIRVNLNNIEVTGILLKDVELWPEGPVIDVPYDAFNGVKFAPDMLKPNGNFLIPRSNFDITVSNSKFSKFLRGVYAYGCKNGNFNFGVNGGNIFTGNNQGLVVNENIGVRVRIMNNDFTIPEWYWDGLDINTTESHNFEYVHTGNMVFDIWNNTFNIKNYDDALGIWDDWRYEHPDNPAWMQILCENNTFNILNDWWPGIWFTFALKDAVFSKNKIVGDELVGQTWNSGSYWIPVDDPHYALSVSENCKFLDNQFLSNVLFLMDWDTQNYLVQGNLSKVSFEDYGTNNRVIGLTNPGHMDAKFEKDLRARMERIHERYNHENNHH